MIKSIYVIGMISILAFSGVGAIEIEFSGDKPEHSPDIIERLKYVSNPSFALLDSIANHLSRNSYLDASVIIRDGRLIVSAGPRYMLTKLILQGDSVTEIAINRPFDSLIIAQSVDKALQKYRDSGYHYVTAETDKLVLSEATLTLFVSINLGPQVKYGEPHFAGLTRSDRKLVIKYIPENETNVLTSEYLNEVERAAAQIPFVKFNPPVTLQPRPGYTVSDVVFNFLEKTPVRFDGAAGFTGQESAGAVWSLALTMNNLFGQGKEISIVSERRDARRNILKIGYTQPIFLTGLGELNLNISARDYRDEFYEFTMSSGIKSRINNNFVTGIGCGWKSVEPKSGNAGYNKFSGEFSISRKSFAADFNPSGGLALEWRIDVSFRRYTSPILPPVLLDRTHNETRNKLNLSISQPIFRPVLTQLSLNYEGLETGELLPPLSEMVLIGGPGSLRGYRNEQFTAIRSAYGTFEPRIRFGSGYLFTFYDAAYLYNRFPAGAKAVSGVEQFRWSYGLGFGIGNSTRNLIMSFGINPDFGFNEPRLSIDLSSDL